MRPLLLALLFVGCIHHVGDPCMGSDAFCGDPKTNLSCRDGKLAPFPCQGAKGCSVDANREVMCDQTSGAQIGEACLPENSGHGQCAGTTLIQCADGTWKTLACSPGKRCVQLGGNVTCQ